MNGNFTSLTAWPAEGARVGIISCTLCGAAILLGGQMEADTIALHEAWHDAPAPDAMGGA